MRNINLTICGLCLLATVYSLIAGAYGWAAFDFVMAALNYAIATVPQPEAKQ